MIVIFYEVKFQLYLVTKLLSVCFQIAVAHLLELFGKRDRQKMSKLSIFFLLTLNQTIRCIDHHFVGLNIDQEDLCS